MKTDENSLTKHIKYFTEFTPNRHFGNLEALNKCADDIELFFSQNNLTTQRQSWHVRGNEYHNIIGSLYPEAKKRLIVGAHYDVYGNNPGADDNASGMAGLLEAARLIAKAQPQLDYGIDFVAYCLEEPPFFGSTDMGSYVHAQSIASIKDDIIGMICYDMIGYFDESPNSQKFPIEALSTIYPNQGNFILVVGCEDYRTFSEEFHSRMNNINEMDVQLIVFADSNDLGGLSDHRNYWSIGINALMINNSAFMRNPNYHEKTDTIDTLDFKKMKETIDASIGAIIRF